MSDVVIIGMEMPKNCLYCHFISYDNDRCVAIDKDIPIYGTKPSWCPLVPLPEGHGDLIDRDAFRADNWLNAKCEHCPTNTYECQHDMIHTKMEFCGMLDDAPVIVPAEGGTKDGA